ncbi:MAG: LamG-like jellyroll fold domain-containing protein [Planctomycetota bacterium]
MPAVLLLSLFLIFPADGPPPAAIAAWPSLKAGDTRLPGIEGGPELRLSGDLQVVEGAAGPFLRGEGMTGRGVVAPGTLGGQPTAAFTVCAWVAMDAPTEWGGVIGALQDNGGFEKGWLLGSRRDRFAFALATVGSDDGDGMMTYLVADAPFTPGRWHHVAGVYDGAEMRLYVDGRLAGSSREQSGPVLHAEDAPFVVGCYLDDNEYYPHAGGIADPRIHEGALEGSAIERIAAERASLRDAPPLVLPLRLVVEPYLQGVSRTGMTIRWETSRAVAGRVEYGTTAELGSVAEAAGESRMQEVRLEGLAPRTNHFYRIVAGPAGGETVTSAIHTFQTAVLPEDAFAFAVMGDTQNNPRMTETISQLALGHRPNFIVHCGDLVGTGSVKREWVHEFFAGARDILAHYPLVPTLGNHERDARLYYDYFSLPDPEYFYDFRFGNAHFFVLDTNRPVDPSTDQHRWLRETAAASDARWKFMVHHQPAYTSDSNDYGDTWKLGETGRGDPRVREHLVPLYEELGIDVVFNGHIHLYERTWPIRAGEVDAEGGVVYITTGGAGGGLEQFAPQRTWFSAAKYRGHHFCLVAIHDGVFEFRAYDEEGRLFDLLTIRK